MKNILDMSVEKVEKALLARAETITSIAGTNALAAEVRKQARVHGAGSADADALAGVLAAVVAAEFRELARELHNQ